ncbi:MAG: response regulator transcription factor [Rubrivivax sp.]|nr:response regulator transcription factor [Rubrivivax sp.]
MHAPDHIHVQICHGDALLAAGLRAILRNDPRLHVMDGGDFPDAQVIVADYEQGLTAARKPERPGHSQPSAPKVLVFTSRCSEADVRFALRAGVLGYLVQGCSTQDALQAVHAVHRGARYFCAQATERMASSLAHSALTGREIEVLELLASGLSNKLIARQMNLTVGTIKSHVGAIMGKLGSSSRTQAVIVAAGRGLVQRGLASFERV